MNYPPDDDLVARVQARAKALTDADCRLLASYMATRMPERLAWILDDFDADIRPKSGHEDCPDTPAHNALTLGEAKARAAADEHTRLSQEIENSPPASES